MNKYQCCENAIANGFTVRREKRGNETVLIIIPRQSPNISESAATDWLTLFDTPAFRAFAERTVQAAEAEWLAERED